MLARIAEEGRIAIVQGLGRDEVVQHQGVHARSLCRIGGLFGGGVIVDDVAHDLGEIGKPLFIQPLFDDRQYGRLQRFMHQEIGTGRHGVQMGRHGRVTTEDHAATRIVEAIADGGMDGIMLDGEGRHDQAIGTVDHEPFGRRSPLDTEGDGGSPLTGGRRNGCAVVRDPVAGVERIGGIEAGGDTLNAFGSIKGRRPGAGTADPALQQNRRQAVDMVRMEMGQEDRLNPRGRNTHSRQGSGGPLPAVDQEDLAADDHGAARTRPGRIRHG